MFRNRCTCAGAPKYDIVCPPTCVLKGVDANLNQEKQTELVRGNLGRSDLYEVASGIPEKVSILGGTVVFLPEVRAMCAHEFVLCVSHVCLLTYSGVLLEFGA